MLQQHSTRSIIAYSVGAWSLASVVTVDTDRMERGGNETRRLKGLYVYVRSVYLRAAANGIT